MQVNWLESWLLEDQLKMNIFPFECAGLTLLIFSLFTSPSDAHFMLYVSLLSLPHSLFSNWFYRHFKNNILKFKKLYIYVCVCMYKIIYIIIYINKFLKLQIKTPIILLCRDIYVKCLERPFPL